MKHIRRFMLLLMFIVAMNTISYAAVTSQNAKGTKITITAVRGIQNGSAIVQKTNKYNYFTLEEITGAMQSRGIAFSVQSICDSDKTIKSRYGYIGNEYITSLEVFYDYSTSEIESYLYKKYFRLYAELAGYPMDSSATLNAYFNP